VRLSVRVVLLAPIEVLAEGPRPISPGLAAYEERKEYYSKLGLGTFVERDQIERFSAMPIAQFLSTMAAVRTTPDGHNVVMRAAGSFAGECSPQWYLNGVPLRVDVGETIDQIVSMVDLHAIEVYKGASQLPIEYSGSTGGCGAIGLWTRRH
jgi:hypothetical protein